MRFVKRPVEVEAVKFLIRQDAEDFMERPVAIDAETGDCFIDTLEGTMRCRVMDWIVRGPMGEYYPVKPDIFALTYQEVFDGT